MTLPSRYTQNSGTDAELDQARVAGFFSSSSPRGHNQPNASLLVGKLLVDGTDLFLDVNILHMAKLGLALSVHCAVVTVDGGLLSARQFIFRKSLSGNWVEDVATLAGKTLEVVGDINEEHHHELQRQPAACVPVALRVPGYDAPLPPPELTAVVVVGQGSRLLGSHGVRDSLVGICVVTGIFVWHGLFDSKTSADGCIITVFEGCILKFGQVGRGWKVRLLVGLVEGDGFDNDKVTPVDLRKLFLLLNLFLLSLLAFRLDIFGIFGSLLGAVQDEELVVNVGFEGLDPLLLKLATFSAQATRAY
ncbi:hypothetical protein HG530_001863 [Fusarium avenaceum]|nr:hypothetical protein HG530_001863 [Fusarium avenaceum]